MRTWRTLAFLVFGLVIIWAVVAKGANGPRTGDWTIHKSSEAGKVDFALIEHRHGGSSHHDSDWPVAAFSGIDLTKPGRQDVHFTITRDAGKIDCEGYLNDGEGAGLFHFEPNPEFPRQMQALGFPVNDDQQYGMAVQDVSLDFAREMKGQHLTDLDTDKLVAAMTNLTFDSPFGKVTFRALDHQSTMGAFVGVTAVNQGRGVMKTFRYVDGATVLPSEAEIAKMRPGD